MLNKRKIFFGLSVILIYSSAHADTPTFWQDLKNIGYYLNYGPVLNTAQEQNWLHKHRAGPQYDGIDRRISIPVVPFQLFGIHYEEDIVIEDTNPKWSMHEYAKIKFNEKDMWIATDSTPDGIQTVTADLQDIGGWAPEIAVPRNMSTFIETLGPLNVNKKMLDVKIQYTNPAQENVTVTFTAPRTAKPRPACQDNDASFNHAKEHACVLLNIAKEQTANVSAKIEYENEPDYQIRKVLGLVPVEALLEQTEGGFAISSNLYTPNNTGAHLSIPIPGVKKATPDDPTNGWSTHAEQDWSMSGGANSITGNLTFKDPNTGNSFVYQFNNGELANAKVFAENNNVPLVEVVLSAPLPDFARRLKFGTKVVRNFVMKIDGRTQGKGRFRVNWNGNNPTLAIEPVAPFWFKARPMNVQYHVDSNQATVESQMLN